MTNNLLSRYYHLNIVKVVKFLNILRIYPRVHRMFQKKNRMFFQWQKFFLWKILRRKLCKNVESITVFKWESFIIDQVCEKFACSNMVHHVTWRKLLFYLIYLWSFTIHEGQCHHYGISIWYLIFRCSIHTSNYQVKKKCIISWRVTYTK